MSGMTASCNELNIGVSQSYVITSENILKFSLAYTTLTFIGCLSWLTSSLAGCAPQ
jgi:hypothetical protein